MTKPDYINKIIQINLKNDKNMEVEVKSIVGLTYEKWNDKEFNGKTVYKISLQLAPKHIFNYELTISEWLNLKDLLDYYVEETNSKKKMTKSIEPDNDFSHYSSRFSIMYAWRK